LERVRRAVEAFLSLSWAWSARLAIASVIVASLIFIVSGAVFVSLNNVPTFYGRRIFIPAQNTQTIAEFIVVSIYYALAISGFSLFHYASTGRLTGRAAGYALLGSTLLILFSALGLLSGFAEKV